MLEKIKVSISREDGTPVCPGMPDPDHIFLTDASSFLIVKKDGGTAEAVSGDISALLEFAARQLEALSAKESRELCEVVGLEFHPTSQVFS